MQHVPNTTNLCLNSVKAIIEQFDYHFIGSYCILKRAARQRKNDAANIQKTAVKLFYCTVLNFTFSIFGLKQNLFRIIYKVPLLYLDILLGL